MLISVPLSAVFGAIGGAVDGAVIAYLMSMPQKGRVVKWLVAERASHSKNFLWDQSL